LSWIPTTGVLRNGRTGSAPEFFGFRNRDDAKEVFRQAVDLRNNLVHGHDLVEGTSWAKAIAEVEKIRHVLDRCERRRAEFEQRCVAAKLEA
jgi:hypothetical protein